MRISTKEINYAIFQFNTAILIRNGYIELPSHHLPCHLYHLRTDLPCLLHPRKQLFGISGQLSRCVREESLHKRLRILHHACELLCALQDTAKSCARHHGRRLSHLRLDRGRTAE
jgi:hypothetical protein